MSKDYERLTEGSEAFIYVAMSRLMARRLAPSWGSSDSLRRRILRSSVRLVRLRWLGGKACKEGLFSEVVVRSGLPEKG